MATFARSVAFDGMGTFIWPTHLSRTVAFGGGITGLGVTSDGDGGAHFVADGNLAIAVNKIIPVEMGIAVLGSVLRQAPTALTVAVANGAPETGLQIRIDGTLVWLGSTDSTGSLAPTSINVPESVGAAGVHTVTAIQVGGSASATFTLQYAPSLNPTTMGPDAAPVRIPASVLSGGRRKWVLQDLMPGGLGSWVMPTNPAEMSSPYLERNYTTKMTTAGRAHISEGARVPVEWTFGGLAPDEAFANKLLAYRNLNRRLYVIDHRGRAFKVMITNLELVPRLRKTYNGVLIDGHDYTMTATVLDQHWIQVP